MEYGLGSVGSRCTVKKTGYEYARSRKFKQGRERRIEGDHLRAQVARYGASESVVAAVSPGRGSGKERRKERPRRSRRETEQLRKRKKGRRDPAACEKDRREKREPRDIQRETRRCSHTGRACQSQPLRGVHFLFCAQARDL